MAFDSRRGRAVLYGGRGSGGSMLDRWEWDGTGWSVVVSRPTTPPALLEQSRP